MADNNYVPQINEDQLSRFGVKMLSRFNDYEQDRKSLEEKWMKNLRQFKGQYDPEVLKNIPVDGSRAYPKITRTKVIGTVARLMEMLFPQTEKNYGIDPSKKPSLSQEDTQAVLDELQAAKAQAAAADPNQPAADLTDEEIEKGIWKLAKKKAARMSDVVEDQLQEIDYVTLARKVVFSGTHYNVGVLKGPLVKREKERTWSKDLAGRYVANEVDRLVPYFEHVPVWNLYPDLSAKTREQRDGIFERHVMSRAQVRALADRPDFLGERVLTWLQRNSTGNFVERSWETLLRTRGDKKNVSDISARKYELVSWWGFVSGHDLKAAGLTLPDSKLGDEWEAEVWQIGNWTIKAVLNPYQVKIRPYHEFVFEEDDETQLGNSLCDTLRDSALAIGEAARMLLDNASVVCGDMLEINDDMLLPGQDRDIYARKIWWRSGDGADNATPAVRRVPMDSHIGELITLIELFKGFSDTEAALPPPALGDVSQGGSEALRTTRGASMLLGAAALPIRDTVRSFDKFTKSLITSLYHWNMQFNPDDSIKGDYTVIARGSTSLIAKEVLAQSLDQLAATLTPEERVYLKEKEFVQARIKVRDLPADLMEDDEVVEQKQADIRDQQAKAAQGQQAMVEAQVKELLSQVFKNLALGRKADTSAQVDAYESIIGGLESGANIGEKAAAARAGNNGASPKSD